MYYVNQHKTLSKNVDFRNKNSKKNLVFYAERAAKSSPNGFN